MKKLIIRTAIITLCVSIVLAISVIGILSFCAPAVMMRLTASLGMKGISGDFAYEEYARSGDISYLARSFELAAEKSDDRIAEERFRILYGEEGSEQRAAFDKYCAEYKAEKIDGVPALGYRMYLCGQAAAVKYRLASTAEEKTEVWAFAAAETDDKFSAGNPVVMLCVEALSREDGEFCIELYGAIRAETRFDSSALDYIAIVNLLEGTVHA